MTKPDDILRAIIADPANDDLRLVFADLLDDRGEGERGEFIMVQCELRADFPRDKPFALGSEEMYDRWRYLMERERELIRSYAWKWLRDSLPDALYADYDRWREEGNVIHSKREEGSSLTFSRGFVNEVRCTYADWVRHADAITARCPIERVTLTTMPGVLEIYYLSAKHGFGGSLGNRIDRWLEIIAAEWPRITFTLPADQEMSGKVSPTQSAALDALSKAALLWARQTEPATSV